MKDRFKQFYYCTLPYLYYRIFCPQSPKIECFQFLKEHRYSYPFPHEFILEYDNFKTDIYENTENGLKYVLHKGDKKLYFPKNYTDNKIQKLYHSLIIEQDVRSPHHYVDSVEEFRDKTLLDIGSAEGLIALEAIEAVNFVYLFECKPEWIEALNATFEPWKEKVSIIRKYISNRNNETSQTLDDFLKEKPRERLFLKMDIEGAERLALTGASQLFSEVDDLQFAICVYHKKDDAKVISSFLNRYKCAYFFREGFWHYHHKMRPCLIRGSKLR